MMTAGQPVVRPIREEDREQARDLILQGLAERWGALDDSKNPDLDNIAASYARGVFLVAYLGEELVGTGALVLEEEGVGRIVRMSVARDRRRQGIGRRILRVLLDQARAAGYRRIVLETTATWAEAIAFYRREGFRPVGVRDGNMHFFLEL